MRHHEDDDRLWEELAHKGIRVLELIIARLEREAQTSLQLSIQGEPMADFQLNAGDSVVVTVTDTDNVTGAVVVPDAGSVTAVLSSPTDTITPNADGTYTVTAAATDVGSVGNTVTANATVGGVASTAGVGTYDVIAIAVTPPPPDATTLAVTFGTETPPAAAAPAGDVGPGAGQINPTTGLVNP